MNKAILLLCGLSVVAFSFGPLVARIVHLGLLKYCPPYAERHRLRVTKAFTALRDDGRHWEACRQAERYYGALGRIRGKIRMHLMLQWLESAVLAHDPRALHLAAYLIDHGHYVANAHEYAGVVCAGNGFSAEAEQHYAIARDLYDKEGKPKSRARVFIRTAYLRALEGCFEDARSLYPRIIESNPDAGWQVTLIEANIHVFSGRYSDALPLMNQALQNSDAKNRPRILVSLARVKINLHQGEAAQSHLQEAVALSPQDEYIAFSAAMLTARILAMQKLKPDALAMYRRIKAELGRYIANRLPHWPSRAIWPPHAQPSAAPSAAWPPPPQALPTNDRNAIRRISVFAPRARVHDFCMAMGRVTLDLEEYEQSLNAWKRLLLCKPGRVSMNYSYYHIGECRRALGDNQSAAEAYRAAVGIGIETHYTKLARERLQELEVA